MSEAKHLHCIARIQAAAFGLTEEAMIERLEAGMYPGLVAGYMKLVAQRSAERNRLMTVFEEMALGYTLMISEQEILIKGPYCQYLSKALLSINGYWDGQGGAIDAVSSSSLMRKPKLSAAYIGGSNYPPKDLIHQNGHQTGLLPVVDSQAVNIQKGSH